MSRLRVFVITVVLAGILLVGDVVAQGRREADAPDNTDQAAVEMTIRAEDGDVVEGAAVIVVGQVTRVGNEPFVTTVVRTAAPEDVGAGSVWVLELTGELVEEIVQSYQERVVVLEGVLETLPAGVSYGRVRVRTVSFP